MFTFRTLEVSFSFKLPQMGQKWPKCDNRILLTYFKDNESNYTKQASFEIKLY